MLQNGRSSCAGNSRNAHVRCFFVKDKVSEKEIRVEHCPSTLSLADFFMNPLQGQLFQKSKEVLMGCKLITVQ